MKIPAHEYDSFCGCDDCNLHRDEQDNIRDSEAAEEWDAIVADREEAEARRIESEENERTEREDSYRIEF